MAEPDLSAPTPAEPRKIDKSRWPALSPHLDELLELGPAERAARLAALRMADPTLADDLQALLASLDTLDRNAFLETPALLPPASLGGETVGAYTIERELGQGGMGSVWLARRTDGRFEGQVAIKFLHAGLVPRADAERFAREGRILARLAHPHIARLIDAGVHSPGAAGRRAGGAQPYLVLEYVDGLSIDQHCAHHGLGLTARLMLFLDVLAAVAHAHTRLILHRDIKPSNILVTAAGEVKLLDFGIAKLMRDAQGGPTTGAPVAATELTQRAGRAFTVQYAAPEQLQNGEVTTASDVYSLGVLLYVLLGGTHPTTTATATAVDQMRATLEQQPRRLSDTVMRRGGPDAARQARALRGDLDTIVAKALKKSPGERYPNAQALADDLRRHLAHEPIAARRDTAAYVLAKFVQRHRAGVAAGGIVLLAIVAGAGIALHEAREARRQQVQAEGLIEFMLGDLRKKLQPVGRLDALDAVGGRALDYYAAQDAGRLDAESLGRRARALHLIGEIADERGDLDEASRVFRQAAESTAALMQRHPGDGQRLFDHSQSLYWVGFVARQRRQVDEAEHAFRGYLDLAERLVRLDPARLDWRIEQAYANQNLGVLQLERARPAQALKAFTAARDTFRAAVPQRADLVFDQANSQGWVAKAQEAQGELVAALAAQQAKLATLQALPHADTDRRAQRLMANAMHEQGRLHLALGHATQAAAAAQEALSRFEALLAVDPNNMDWQSQATLARLALAEAAWAHGDRTVAAQALRRAEADNVRLLANTQTRATWRLAQQGQALRLRLAFGERWPSQRAALDAYLAQVRQAEAHGLLLDTDLSLLAAATEVAWGDVLLAENGAAAARTPWQSAVDRLRAAADSGHAPAATLLAQALWRLGKHTEAHALAARVASSAYRHPDLADLQRRLASGEGAASDKLQ
ncbi:MAG TPA: protein kinase [Ideonella sp.]|uniref:serine/threonine-protein kinase n=1 Tax=Ideonella sp. TaxID=1929293 RepID=UPI002E312A36|nr:protein kinase [Ideonella sp.]HEX5686987.1 protein kinase [Ideonella sp.]